MRAWLPHAVSKRLCVAQGKVLMALPLMRTDRTETILLVEEDELVRESLCTVLDIYGYDVLIARTGEEAIDISRSHSGAIHLLITDVFMPNMKGPELVDHIKKLRPETKVLFMSGYPDHVIAEHGGNLVANAFIQKPFTGSELARKARELSGA